MATCFLVGQVGKYEATGNHIDTLGAAIIGHRTAAQAVTQLDLADGDEKTITIYSGTTGAPSANCLVWRATWDNTGTRWTRVSELVSFGTISDEDDVSVFVVSGVPDYPESTGGKIFALRNGALIEITDHLVGTVA